MSEQTQPAPGMSPEEQKITAEAKKTEADAAARMAATENYQRAMQVQTTFMNPATWTQIRSMAKVFHESKALPSCIQNEAQLVMVMQAGYEMGMTPVECLNSLYIVNGTVNIYGKAITRRLREHGWRIEYKNETETECTARVVRGRESYQETFTYAMAEASNYTKSRAGDFKVGWLPGMNRKLKLRYGALSIIIRSYIPDVMGSVNDIKEIVEDVEIITEKKPEITTGAGAPVNSTLQQKLNDAKNKKGEEIKPEVINGEEVKEPVDQGKPPELPVKEEGK